MPAQRRPRPQRITPDVLRALQAHLRRRLTCPTLSLDPPAQPGASVEVRIGRETVGTVDQVDEDGERSWAVTLVVLEDDLALVGPTARRIA